MEVEYSNEVRGQVHAFRFEAWEKEVVAEALKVVVKKLEAKAERVRNNPKNEGQATYAIQRQEFQREAKHWEGVIETFLTK